MQFLNWLLKDCEIMWKLCGIKSIMLAKCLRRVKGVDVVFQLTELCVYPDVSNDTVTIVYHR